MHTAGLLPLAPGLRLAVVGPHAAARATMLQPYPFEPYCADPEQSKTASCIESPLEALSRLNAGGETRTARGAELFGTGSDAEDARLVRHSNNQPTNR